MRHPQTHLSAGVPFSQVVQFIRHSLQTPGKKTMKPKNITIFYLSFGSGHQVAAESLAAALRREAPSLRLHVVDPFANNIELLPKVIDSLQALSITLIPGLYDTLWRKGTPGSLYESITELSFLQDLLIGKIRENDARIIVATHVMATAMSLSIKAEYPIEKVFGVVTDFGLNSYWPLEGVDAYFVAHRELKNTFAYRGCQPEKIYPTGIPIRLPFENICRPINTNPGSPLHILLITGGVRSGAYVDVKNRLFSLLETLNTFDSSMLHLTIVTGNQEKIYQSIREKQNQYAYKIDTRGFVDDMSALISSHDLVISKPGGLIVSECMACGTPMILFQAGPGQEQANVEFLARHGAALQGTPPDMLRKSIETLINHPERLAAMSQRALVLGKPFAARMIAKHILRLSHT